MNPSGGSGLADVGFEDVVRVVEIGEDEIKGGEPVVEGWWERCFRGEGGGPFGGVEFAIVIGQGRGDGERGIRGVCE